MSKYGWSCKKCGFTALSDDHREVMRQRKAHKLSFKKGDLVIGTGCKDMQMVAVNATGKNKNGSTSLMATLMRKQLIAVSHVHQFRRDSAEEVVKGLKNAKA